MFLLGFQRPAARLIEQGPDNAVVFFRLDGTGRVDYHTGRADLIAGSAQQF
jgi:hypothetical protein